MHFDDHLHDLDYHGRLLLLKYLLKTPVQYLHLNDLFATYNKCTNSYRLNLNRLWLIQSKK